MGADTGQSIDFGRDNRQDHAKLLTSIKHALALWTAEWAIELIADRCPTFFYRQF